MAAVISSISPATGNQGDVLATVTITGTGTTFAAGTSALTFSNAGIAASNVVVVDATHITATLTIDKDAATGPGDVTVTTGAEVAVGTGLFNVGLSQKALVLREAVSTYLREHETTLQERTFCLEFITDIDQAMRGVEAGTDAAIDITVAAAKAKGSA